MFQSFPFWGKQNKLDFWFPFLHSVLVHLLERVGYAYGLHLIICYHCKWTFASVRFPIKLPGWGHQLMTFLLLNPVDFCCCFYLIPVKLRCYCSCPFWMPWLLWHHSLLVSLCCFACSPELFVNSYSWVYPWIWASVGALSHLFHFAFTFFEYPHPAQAPAAMPVEGPLHLPLPSQCQEGRCSVVVTCLRLCSHTDLDWHLTPPLCDSGQISQPLWACISQSVTR